MLGPEAALRLAAGALAAAPSAIVLVDGRSGAGKSTFASALAARAGAHLLRLDEVYPGWSGLDAGADAVARALETRRSGRVATVASWDWATGRPGAEHRLPAAGPLVVEGCGAIRPATRATADLALWLELGADARRLRALARDGDLFRPHWDAWARAEAVAIARDDPRRLADRAVDARESAQGTLGGHSVPFPA